MNKFLYVITKSISFEIIMSLLLDSVICFGLSVKKWIGKKKCIHHYWGCKGKKHSALDQAALGLSG